MPKPKSKSNKNSSSQPETPPAPEQQLLSIKPKRPIQEPVVEAEKTSAQPVEQKLLSIKPKKTEEVTPPSEAREQSDQDKQLVVPPSERRLESSSPKEVIPSSERHLESSSAKEATPPSERRPESGFENQEALPQKPSFQKPQLKKPQPPPYKNLEQVTTSNGDTFAVGEQVRVTTANYGEYLVAIKFIYEAADGSIWASYSHTNKEQRHPWRWGCCRADLLRKESNE